MGDEWQMCLELHRHHRRGQPEVRAPPPRTRTKVRGTRGPAPVSWRHARGFPWHLEGPVGDVPMVKEVLEWPEGHEPRADPAKGVVEHLVIAPLPLSRRCSSSAMAPMRDSP
uniref:Uncharacterized protein n=1 Tax=Oryza nivara TaxID=4536 RepID=A0A0E0GCQ6_ORYNI